jgi:hypothetical protein
MGELWIHCGGGGAEEMTMCRTNYGSRVRTEPTQDRQMMLTLRRVDIERIRKPNPNVVISDPERRE